MANNRPKPEEIFTKLRQVEILTGQGMLRLDAIRQIGVTEQTYYRWKKKHGGMGTDQLKELKRLQKENERLRKAVSDLTLDKLILSEAAKGNSNSKQSSFQGAEHPTLKLFFLANNTTVKFSKNTVVNSLFWANLSGVGTSIAIGEHCLFVCVKARTSDSHHIIELRTNKMFNRPGDIIIDEHVWIAEGVLLLKNTCIGSNSVIGARSLVNGKIPPNSLAAGTPARVIRENISWRYSAAHLNPPVN